MITNVELTMLHDNKEYRLKYDIDEVFPDAVFNIWVDDMAPIEFVVSNYRDNVFTFVIDPNKIHDGFVVAIANKVWQHARDNYLTTSSNGK